MKWTSFFELDRDTHNINFKKANLVDASFIRNSYKKVNFQQADLTDSYFNTNMQDVNFLGANLTGIKLGYNAKLKNVKYNSRSFKIDGRIVPPSIYEVDFFNQKKITNAVDLSR
ncbi:MAG: pentapeptide repeat-containing protein [archaeon]|nr:pentapeptide repeat-containing protein [archaeon]